MPKLQSSRVKTRMAELDMSLEKLANQVDMTRGTLKNAVNGLDPIRLGRVHRIARALYLTPDEIIADGNTNKSAPDERSDQPENTTGSTRAKASAA